MTFKLKKDLMDIRQFASVQSSSVPDNVCFGFLGFLVFVFFPFIGCPAAYKVPRPGIRSELAVVTCAPAVATLDPLTQCVGPGTTSASWCCRDAAADPLAPQRELHPHCAFVHNCLYVSPFLCFCVLSVVRCFESQLCTY